jgi:hypothetical protein
MLIPFTQPQPPRVSLQDPRGFYVPEDPGSTHNAVTDVASGFRFSLHAGIDMVAGVVS